MSHWWRAYDEAVDDPKLIMLSDKGLRAWFNLMCLASANDGVLPHIEIIAIKLRMPEKKLASIIEELVARGLLDEFDGTLRPHNWNGRQYKSDVSTDRVKQFRERQRNVSVTPPETEAETEADTESETEKKKDIRAVAKATRPVRDEVFEEFWKAYPKREGANPKTPARKSFDAALKSGVDPPAIIAGARAYAADPSTKIGTSYVAQAVTWLKQKRWEDHVSGITETALDELERHRRECLTRAENPETEVRRHPGMGKNGADHVEELRSSNGMVRGESETMGRQLAVFVARARDQIDGG